VAVTAAAATAAAAIADLGSKMALKEKSECRRFPDVTVGAGGNFFGTAGSCTRLWA
jgi:hypothetical protein